SATGVGAEDTLAEGLPVSPVPPPPLHPSTPRRTSIFTATSSDKCDRYMFISQERAGQRRLRQQNSPDRYRRFYQPDRPARRCTAPRPATSGGCWEVLLRGRRQSVLSALSSPVIHSTSLRQ